MQILLVSHSVHEHSFVYVMAGFLQTPLPVLNGFHSDA